MNLQMIGRLAGIPLALIAIFLSAGGYYWGSERSVHSQDNETLMEAFAAAENMSLNLITERTNTLIAYELPGTIPEEMLKQITSNRIALQETYAELEQLQNTISKASSSSGSKPAKAPLLRQRFAALEQSYQAYSELDGQIEEDLRRTDFRALSSRSISRTFNKLASELISFRQQLRYALAPTNAITMAILDLRADLLILQEFSGRVHTLLGANVANRQPISGIRQNRVSHYSSRERAAWERAAVILQSGLLPKELINQQESIQQISFSGMAEARFELYDLSEVAVDDNPDNNDLQVDYMRSAQEWIQFGIISADPINKMQSAISSLTNQQEPAGSPILSNEANLMGFITVISAVLGFLVLVGFFVRGSKSEQTSQSILNGNLDKTMAEINHLAEKVQVLARKHH